MNAKLLVVIDNVTKHVIPLQLPAVLGRSREADITVAHPLISRRHCELSEDHGLLLLRDLTSLNGTMLAGRRVEFAALLPDGEFTIGPLTFRVVYEYDGDLESVPETRFVDAVDEPAKVGPSGTISAEAEDDSLEIDEVLPVVPTTESVSGEFFTPDLMALADLDPDQALPAVPVRFLRQPRWPPRLPRFAIQTQSARNGHRQPTASPPSHRVLTPWTTPWRLIRRCSRAVSAGILAGRPRRRPWKMRAASPSRPPQNRRRPGPNRLPP